VAKKVPKILNSPPLRLLSPSIMEIFLWKYFPKSMEIFPYIQGEASWLSSPKGPIREIEGKIVKIQYFTTSKYVFHPILLFPKSSYK
jgi:hypothetical protein